MNKRETSDRRLERVSFFRRWESKIVKSSSRNDLSVKLYQLVEMKLHLMLCATMI